MAAAHNLSRLPEAILILILIVGGCGDARPQQYLA
jgi:hypothetical protein